MKKPKRYFVGWIIGENYNVKTALKRAKELNYGENLKAFKRHEGYYQIYSYAERIKP